MNITTAERQTLQTVADPARTDGMPGVHLQKFLRLDLIEPCDAGMCMTLKGKTVLFGGK